MAVASLLCLSLILVKFLTSSASLCGLCHHDWRKVYTNSPDGGNLFGDINDLAQAVQSGSHVRLFIEDWGGTDYATETDNMEVLTGGVVCSQALFHVSMTDQRFQDNAYWWFLKLCTTGNVHVSRYNVGEAVSRGESKIRLKINWFVKDVVCRCAHQGPIFSNSADGSAINGDKTALIAAVLNGQDIRAKTASGYTFPTSNVAVRSSLVSGQTLWHVSQTNVGNYNEFQQNPYWWFTIVSTDGTRDMSRWTIGSHQDRGHTSDTTNVSWFADPCWKKVYAHDANGNAVSGDLASLVAAVEGGHRVRIVRANNSAEADNVRAIDGHVSAQLLSHVSKASIKLFQDNAYWFFEMVDTSGHVHITRYNVGEHVDRGSSESTAAIEWFVDTRHWEMILETNSLGHVLSGSKAAVIDAVRKGASFRISPQICNNGVYVTKANNVQLHPNGEISAMSLKSISVERIPEVGARYKIQNNPYWWFILVNTQSDVSMSRWTLGEHVDRACLPKNTLKKNNSNFGGVFGTLHVTQLGYTFLLVCGATVYESHYISGDCVPSVFCDASGVVTVYKITFLVYRSIVTTFIVKF